MAQVSDALGTAYGAPERVNVTDPVSNTLPPVVTALSGGSWVVACAEVLEGKGTISKATSPVSPCCSCLAEEAP